MLKIVSAKVIVTCPGRNFVTLKLETSDGVTGVGDATLNGRELAVASYLNDHVVPLLIGRDAHRIEDTWQYLYRGAYWRRRPGRRARLLPRQRQDHRRGAGGSGVLSRHGLQGDPPAVGHSGARLNLWRVEGQIVLRTGRRRHPDGECLVDGEIPPLRPAALREGAREAGLGRASPARCASSPDAH